MAGQNVLGHILCSNVGRADVDGQAVGGLDINREGELINIITIDIALTRVSRCFPQSNLMDVLVDRPDLARR